MASSPHSFLSRPILGGEINFPLSLAPMVGLSHVGLRLLVKRYLPVDAKTIWPTEMLSSWRLDREELGKTPETLRTPDETHLVPQILGNEEGPIRESVLKLVDWGAVGIDINMGCPVRKALKHNYGVALMGDAGYAAEVVAMTVRHAKVPVSVKLRAGLQNDMEYLLRFVCGLEDAGASWVTLHPRVAAMKRRGSADWSQIGAVREAVKIPVFGNGDVQCEEDVFAIRDASGCDGVMIGRALAARPWLFWQVGETLGFGSPIGFEGRKAPRTPEEEGAESGDALKFFWGILVEHFSFEGAFTRFRFHLRMTSGWLEFGHALFSSASGAKSDVEMRAVLDNFFSVEQRMYKRTQLRE